MAGKTSGKTEPTTSADLDAGLAPVIGKHVYFFIRINPTLVQKFPAQIVDNFNLQRKTGDNTLNIFIEKQKKSATVLLLDVSGANGHFMAESYLDSSREPGTCDTIKPGDLVT